MGNYSNQSVLLDERNKRIVERRLKGETFTAIGLSLHLSSGYVADVFRRERERPAKLIRRRRLLTSERISAEKRERLLSDEALLLNRMVDGHITTHLTINDKGFGRHPPLTIDELADHVRSNKYYNIGKTSAWRVRELTEEEPQVAIKPIRVPAWVRREQSACDQIRAACGIDRYGEGVKALEALKQGGELSQELARVIMDVARSSFWSMDRMDAMLAVYAGNPMMQLLLKAAEQTRRTGKSPFTKPVLKVVGEDT